MTARIATIAALLLFAAALVMWSIGIWVNDYRWGGLGAMAAIAAVVCLVIMGLTFDERRR